MSRDNITNSNVHILDILLSFAYNNGCQSGVALHDLLLSKSKSSVISSSRRHSSYHKVGTKRDNKNFLVTVYFFLSLKACCEEASSY